MRSDTPEATSHHESMRSVTFLVVAVVLLYITTARFTGDLPAFLWSLIVLGGVMYLE